MKHTLPIARVTRTPLSELGRACFLILLLLVTSSSCTKDLYLVGLVPFEGEWHGGRAMLSGYELALKHINGRKDILAGYKLNILWNDTKCDAGHGLDLFYWHMYHQPPKLMVLGACCSHVSESTAQVSFRWNLVQISPVSSSPVLSNRKIYKRFFRLISSDNNVNAASLALIKLFKWKKVSIIHTWKKIFNEKVADLVKLLKQDGIQIITSQTIRTDEVKEHLLELRKTDSRIIFGDFYADVARKVFCEAYKIKFYGPHIVWIMGGWYQSDWFRVKDTAISCTPEQIMKVLNGQIILTRRWISPRKQLSISGFTPQRTFELLEQNISDENVGMNMLPMAYDSVWVAALAINQTINDLLELGGKKKIEDFNYKDDLIGGLLFNNTMKSNFEGVSGLVNFDKKKGSHAKFRIGIFMNGKVHEVGMYDPELQTDSKTEWNTPNAADSLWDCGIIPKDSYIVIETLSLTLYIIMCCFACLGILLSCFFLIISFIYRGQRWMHATSRRLNIMALIGCLLLYTTVFLENTQPFTEVTLCQVKGIFLVVGFSMTFGALFAKEWRTYRIFVAGSKKKANTKDYQLFLTVFLYVALNLIIIIVRFIFDPMKVVLHDLRKEGVHESEILAKEFVTLEIQKCESPNQNNYLFALFGIQIMMMLLGIFLAIQTRNVQMKILSNARIVGACVYIAIIMCILGVILSQTFKYMINLNYGIVSFIVIFGTTLTQCLLLIPMVRAYLKHGDDFQFTESETTPVGIMTDKRGK